MLNLFVLFSQIEQKSSTEARLSRLVNKLLEANHSFVIKGYFSKVEELQTELQNNGKFEKANLIINASGGTEALIEFIVENSKEPSLILANSQKNSFASSLEAYAYLKDNFPIKVFYSDNDSEIISTVDHYSKAINTLKKINSSHFCAIGNPSDWLLTSKNFSGFGNFKTKFSQIEVEQLIEEVNKIPEEKTKEITDEWKSSFYEVLVEDKSLIDSAKVYLALKQLVSKEKIDVLTVRCFDLLAHNYTACMGLSICNDEGTTSGCEGDLPTTFTMKIAQELSGDAVWMANPSSIDKERKQIIFAHCSVPRSFLKSVKESGLTTHMESGLSTAIRGPLHKTEVTIMRISNDFKKMNVVKGRIVETDMKDAHLCRTQAVIEIESDVEKWIESTFGNHHVIVYGDITPEIKHFCDFAGIALITI